MKKNLYVLILVLLATAVGVYFYVQSQSVPVFPTVTSGTATTTDTSTSVGATQTTIPTGDRIVLGDADTQVYAVKGGKTYCKGTPIGADAQTFHALTTMWEVGNVYAADKSSVYVNCDMIPGADPKSFSVVDQDAALGRDATHLYLKTGNVAPLSLKSTLSTEWPSDGKPGSVGSTRFLSMNGYLVNVDGVAYMANPRTSEFKKMNLDAASVFIFDQVYDHPEYLKDKNAVYCRSDSVYLEPLSGADPKTFRSPTDQDTKVIAGVDGADALHLYSMCKVVK